jgi:hypothetical protein
MIIRSNQSNILKRILEDVILQEPGGQLEIALQQCGNVAAKPSLMSWL